MAKIDLAAKREGSATLLDPVKVDEIIRNALREDLGSGDITTDAIFADEQVHASLLTKDSGVLAGLNVFRRVFELLDEKISFVAHFADGDEIAPGDVVATFSGAASSILKAERTALNLLQRMSGIATQAARYVEAIRGTNARILDTRKTIPGLRMLDKYAVSCGGASNHRIGLYDATLIKDNHIEAAGGIRMAVEKVRAAVPPEIEIEVETTNLDQVQEALECKADIIMLDNMTLDEMRDAVRLVAGRALTEASGGITLENVREVAETGVNHISIGALTHSVIALDLSLEVHQR